MKSAFRGSFKAFSLCTDASQRVSFSLLRECVRCDAMAAISQMHPDHPAHSEWHKENKESAWFLHVWNLYFLLSGMRKRGIAFHSSAQILSFAFNHHLLGADKVWLLE
jgi:hypothetical protein